MVSAACWACKVELHASNILAIFDHDKKPFQTLLLRLAIFDTSHAVLLAILALSSLHRYGLQPETLQLNSRVLHALGHLGNDRVDASSAIRHIATLMILCHFEVCVFSGYLCGSKYLIHKTDMESLLGTSDFSALLDWVNYHVVDNLTCRQGMLRLLQDLFRGILRPSDRRFFTDEYEQWLNSLETRISSAKLAADKTSKASGQSIFLEIYQLAALTYLARASRDFSGQSEKINRLLLRAFKILGSLDTFSYPSYPFPLLIFGCEARNDSQRRLILDLIEGAMQTSSSAGLGAVQEVVQKVWIQDDFATEHGLSYVSKLDTIITSCTTMPNFA
ncbi:hypothetical protein GQ53DRAFT_791009 [Thozetella sp. PMI_491]|nr:hypothetical protein GQ53DRAFT_791009 [Thozetella sp. PMI_491]